MWCLFGWRGRSRGGARCARVCTVHTRVCTGSDHAGLCLLSCRWGDPCWSGRHGQCAEPLPLAAAQAQRQVAELAALLEERGVEVIHSIVETVINIWTTSSGNLVFSWTSTAASDVQGR
jgi:hypothetical protein